ncbi:MAG: hypothetical protein ACO1OF_16360 [Adhaeribacter sp.]
MSNQRLISGHEMRKFGNMVKKLFPGKAFCVFTFDFGPGGVGNYLSNANREDMIKALREMADALEQGKVFPTPENN